MKVNDPTSPTLENIKGIDDTIVGWFYLSWGEAKI